MAEVVGGDGTPQGRWSVRRTPRLAVNIVDQAFSSGTNFLAMLIAARMLGPDEFGPVTLAFSIAFLAMTFQRAAVGEPMMALLAPMPPDAQRRNSWAGLSTSLLIGIVLCAVCAAAGASPWHLTSQCLVIAAFVPVLLVQDSLRYLAFAARRPLMALRSDAAWLLAEAAVLTVLVVRHERSGAWFVVAWGVGAAVGLAFAPWSLAAPQLRPRVRDWLRLSRRLAPWLFAQSVVSQAAVQVIVFIVGGILGSAALGGYRAVQTLMQPVLTATVALIAFLVPRYARALADGGNDAVAKGVRQWSVLTAGFALPFAISVSLGAPWLVHLVYGGAYDRFAYLVPIFAASVFLQTLAMPAASALRALLEGRRLLAAQLASSAVAMTAVPIAAALFGLGPVVGASVLSSGVVVAVIWHQFKRATAQEGETTPSAPSARQPST